MRKINKVCVYGIGGVGGYFGGMMAYNISIDETKDQQIYFIARGAHLEEIKIKGLVLSFAGQKELICKPFWAGDKFVEMPQADLILLCIKSYDLEAVLHEIAPRVNEDTIIVPLLNGIDIYDRIRKIIDKGVVLPACVYVAAHVEKPGNVILDDPKGGFVVLGLDPENKEFMPQNVLDLFGSLGIHYKWFDNPFPAIWEKYLFVASFALVTAYYEKGFKEVTLNEESKKFVIDVMHEIIEIAGCEGVVLDKEIIDRLILRAEGLNEQARSSFQRDIEKGNQRNENDIFGTSIINLGKKHGVKTPAIEKALDKILSGLGV